MGIESVSNKENIYPAIGSRLLEVPEVLTLGVKPNFLDYTPEEREFIKNAGLILYPTRNYAQFLTTMGKKIFPSLETYLYADEKIKQTTLFYMLNIPHPRTRIYYHLHHKDILNHFNYPFIAKLPRSSARGRGGLSDRQRGTTGRLSGTDQNRLHSGIHPTRAGFKGCPD